MRAWLITKEYSNKEKVVALINSKKSSSTILDFVNFIYANSFSNFDDRIYFLKHPKEIPDKAKYIKSNGVVYGFQITAGGRKRFYARIVKIDEVKKDSLFYKEPIRPKDRFATYCSRPKKFESECCSIKFNKN